MRKSNCFLALTIAALLASCGGDSTTICIGDPPPKKKISAEIIFGDSLADVGTYAVGAVAAAGGGKYTINGDYSATNPELTGKIWAELIATKLRLPDPCAAMTGLDGDATLGFSVPAVIHAGCYDYAQGGARVTNPVGPLNRLTGSPLGQLTVPVVTQVSNHLARSGGSFTGDEVVFVTAGGNDVFALLAQLAAGAAAAGQAAAQETFISVLVAQLSGCACDRAAAAADIEKAMRAELARPGHTDESVVQAAVAAAAKQPGHAAVADPAVYGPMVAKAKADAAAAGADAGAKYAADHGPDAVSGMAAAAAELAALVKNGIVGNGANFVVVNNLPDVASTPGALAQPASTQALIKAMVAAFNDQLKAGVGNEAKVQLVDLYAFTHDQTANPAQYGLTNTTMPACGPNLLGGLSLVCTLKNTVPGDVSHYMFADSFHPTPYEHSLVARYIWQQIGAKGWP